MSNADLARIINSDEIQTKVRAAREGFAKPSRKRNALTNLGTMLKLNPYVGQVKRAETAAAEADEPGHYAQVEPICWTSEAGGDCSGGGWRRQEAQVDPDNGQGEGQEGQGRQEDGACRQGCQAGDEGQLLGDYARNPRHADGFVPRFLQQDRGRHGQARQEQKVSYCGLSEERARTHKRTYTSFAGGFGGCCLGCYINS